MPPPDQALASGAFDEAAGTDGVPRPHYRELLEVLAGLDLAALAGDVEQGVRAAGATFRVDGAAGPFRLDPVPGAKDTWVMA